MAIKKFKVEVILTKEYTITIDDEIYNDEFMKSYSEVFHEIDELEDIAKELATMQAMYGEEYDFIEGYGYVTRNGKLPFSRADYDHETGNILPEDMRRKAAMGVDIGIDSEDEEMEYNIQKIN